MAPVDIKDALQLTNTYLFDSGDTPLNEDEKAVLRGTWQKETFKQIAEKLDDVDADHLRTCVGRRLWLRLAVALNVKEVTKHTYRKLIEEKIIQDSASKSDENSTEYRFDKSDGFSVLIGQPPSVNSFVGRGPEIAMLSAAIKENQCISLIGAPGIGKSALASKVSQMCPKLPEQFKFEACIWKSLNYGPSLTELLAELVSLFGITVSDKDIPQLTNDLLQCLRKHRLLIVFDSVEALMKEASRSNPWGHHTEYRSFVHRIIEEQHRSCFIFCSQEPIREVKSLQNNGFAARSFKIEGLGKDAIELLKHTGLKNESVWKQLIADYQGNPYALLEVAEKINDFFGGDASEFLELNTIRVDDPFTETLLDQICRSSYLEQDVLANLAKMSPKSIDFKELCGIFSNHSRSDLMTAVTRLESRSLINKSSDQPFQLSISKIVKKLVMLNAKSTVSQSDSIPLTA
ncbi:hypothetical protein C1752_12237 [Acaryochloris thomasi RCC1774]|uniref:Uncharacterized protein n=1 Tax=Acaryochloris thomasi RCC1774 TaxID=1764569 RepID=A0A2W1JJL7_9CYAN|nr:ATP-binding protein [Acaryochloris thomasi]PZD70454.1 hypothetical protein C1752_12237 [Acaryochloris thomasi RCC1774]